MREILFRGKRIDTKEWIEGITFPHDNNKVTMFSQHSTDGCLVGEEVDPETVGQFTGLTDKNGVKIFEGDIVRVNYNDSDGEDYEDVVLVAYDGESGGFSPYTWNYSCDGCDCGVYVYSVEVIGNIYDNPELLGGAEDETD